MSDTVSSPLARPPASPSRDPGPTRFFPRLKRSNVKRIGVAPRAGLPENAPAKAVVDLISHDWHFDDPVFLKDLTFTLARDVDRNVFPPQVINPSHSLSEK